MAVEQEFNSHLVPEMHIIQQATSEFKDFAFVWWYGLAVTNALPSIYENNLNKQCVVILFLFLINVI
jgi:hypothetical protein